MNRYVAYSSTAGMQLFSLIRYTHSTYLSCSWHTTCSFAPLFTWLHPNVADLLSLADSQYPNLGDLALLVAWQYLNQGDLLTLVLCKKLLFLPLSFFLGKPPSTGFEDSKLILYRTVKVVRIYCTTSQGIYVLILDNINTVVTGQDWQQCISYPYITYNWI